jgi:hypothetical protein
MFEILKMFRVYVPDFGTIVIDCHQGPTADVKKFRTLTDLVLLVHRNPWIRNLGRDAEIKRKSLVVFGEAENRTIDKAMGNPLIMADSPGEAAQ